MERKNARREQKPQYPRQQQQPAELTDILLNLPAKPNYPTFIACGRFYLTPNQQEEASCLKEDLVTATKPRPEIVLQDPLEDPIPPIAELSSETTSLLQEIWTVKQRQRRQSLT
jgi:hypothetical protein